MSICICHYFIAVEGRAKADEADFIDQVQGVERYSIVVFCYCRMPMLAFG